MTDKITVAYGDGIGPEIMKATVKILEAAGAKLDIDTIEVGESVYKQGFTSGMKPDAWEKISASKVLLKAPITTPQGGGYKSLNVTLRKTLGLFANIRPIKSLSPFVTTKHPELDTVIIRENEEDLYAGIEHRQTNEVMQCLKLISAPGCEKIIRYAFEYAKAFNRKKITCMTKDNIMKLTDGLFHDTFDRIKAEYPEIETEHMIIDIGTAKYADTPENFDVIVLPNLYGDILSDVAAQIAGSVGLSGSSNIGEQCAMFEAIHGSAPDIAGQNIANPSGLISASVSMLKYLSQVEVAQNIENAWLKTIEDGVHTADIFEEGKSSLKVGTQEFADELINRLGETPRKLNSVSYDQTMKTPKYKEVKTTTTKTLDGIDVFVCDDNKDADRLGNLLIDFSKNAGFKLSMITNRGVKVFPNGNPHTYCTDHWRCRFEILDGATNGGAQIVKLLGALTENSVEVIKTENLYSFDGKKGYSLGQGQ